MSKKGAFWLFLIIILIASFFRLWHLGEIPAGLYPDEAINGNNAIQALESSSPTGEFKVFYTDNNGREGLFINLQALSIKAFGKSIFSLRFISAIAGVLTIWALYLLAKELYNREIALISSYLLAISFWHVNFSRIGFRAILAPLFLTFAFYFFWRGLKTSDLSHFGISGIFWGLGFYTYIAFRIAPLILIMVLLAHWQTVKRDFNHDKYVYLRDKMIGGFTLLMLTAIFVSIPLGIYFLNYPQDFLGRAGQLSVFSTAQPLKTFFTNLTKELVMFNFAGDWNWRHNFPGSPELLWPVGVLFIAGFLKTCLSLFKYIKKGMKYHGHFSTVPVLVLSWFFLMLLPAAFSNEGIPHALRSIIIIPAVFIMTGKGTWWIFEYLRDGYSHKDLHPREASAVVGLVLIIFLASIGLAEYIKYFHNWASNPEVSSAFNKNYVDIGDELNRLSGINPKIKKYVFVNTKGVLVNNIPIPAQTVMFITDTSTPEKQKAKNIFYLTEEQYKKEEYDKNSIIIPLER